MLPSSCSQPPPKITKTPSHHLNQQPLLLPLWLKRLISDLPFNGDQQKGKGFINACQAYFHLRPDQFQNDQTKIQWAMTYMNQGRAQKWVNQLYHWEAIPANIGNPHFVDWNDFCSRFRTEFFPLHSDAAVTNRLVGTAYFQGRQTVDDLMIFKI
jgi:hypothetical protein